MEKISENSQTKHKSSQLSSVNRVWTKDYDRHIQKIDKILSREESKKTSIMQAKNS